jgi:hypothetical protein
MVQIQLSEVDATFLCDQLKRHMSRLDDELVHTDKRSMQRDIAKEVDHLRAVLGQIEDGVVSRDLDLMRHTDAR